jgi:hypothetical protein
LILILIGVLLAVEREAGIGVVVIVARDGEVGQEELHHPKAHLVFSDNPLPAVRNNRPIEGGVDDELLLDIDSEISDGVEHPLDLDVGTKGEDRDNLPRHGLAHDMWEFSEHQLDLVYF